MEIRKLLQKLKCSFIWMFILIMLSAFSVNATDDEFFIKVTNIEYNQKTNKLEFNLELFENINRKINGIKSVYIEYSDKKVLIKKFDELATYFRDNVQVDLSDVMKLNEFNIVVYDNTNIEHIKRNIKVNIDRVKPKIFYSFDYDNINVVGGKAYLSVKPLIKYNIEDDNFYEAYFNNKVIEKTGTIKLEEGSYLPEIVAKDSFGNKEIVNIFKDDTIKEVEVDSTSPIIKTIGINEKFVNKDYFIQVEVSDKNLDILKLDQQYHWIVDGNSAKASIQISDNNSKYIQVQDLAGNTTWFSLPQSIIDKKMPDLEVDGYKRILNDRDKIKVRVNDENFNNIKIDFHGINYDSELYVDKENYEISIEQLPYGKMNMTIHAYDKAGNETKFQGELNRLKSEIEVINNENAVEFNKYVYKIDHPYNIIDKQLIVEKDGIVENYQLQMLDNTLVIPMNSFKDDGRYKLKLYIQDELGVETTKDISDFTVDSQKPIIKIVNNTAIIYDNGGIEEIEILYKNGVREKIRDISSKYRYVIENIDGIEEIICKDISKNIATKKIAKKPIINNDDERSTNYNSPKIFVFSFAILFVIQYIMNIVLLFNMSHMKNNS